MLICLSQKFDQREPSDWLAPEENMLLEISGRLRLDLLTGLDLNAGAETAVNTAGLSFGSTSGSIVAIPILFEKFTIYYIEPT